MLRKAQHSQAPQRVAYRWKEFALHYTMMLLATAESVDDRCDDTLIATTTHTCAETATLTLGTTARTPVNDTSQIECEI